jgi:hypothetical protein
VTYIIVSSAAKAANTTAMTIFLRRYVIAFPSYRSVDERN